ncbi:hypothetical protein PINS_up006654 [Pythium insidiosum]|nr:hypothetical protein PINS_up006654 [Pythium insidiosum]
MHVCNFTQTTVAHRSDDHSSATPEWGLASLLCDDLLLTPDAADAGLVDATTLQLEDSPSVLESLLRDPNVPDLVTFFDPTRGRQPLDVASDDYSSLPNRQTIEAAVVAPSRKARISPDEKKRRNRECMRRLRHRRIAMIAAMREEVAALNQELRNRLSQRTVAVGVPRRTTGSATFHRNDVALKITLQQLREENYWLQQQLQRHHATLNVVRDVLRDHDGLLARPQLNEEEDMVRVDDPTTWMHATSCFISVLPTSKALQVVLESFMEINEHLAIARSSERGAESSVLGWSSHRWVDGYWANFVLEKEFPQESARPLALKTWKLVSDFSSIKDIQPIAQSMKVIQRLNEHALVIARQTYFKETNQGICTAYLLFLMETKDGFVIGTRSLEPDWMAMKPFLTGDIVYGKLWYCFHFEKLTSGGCRLTFGGRVNNVYPHFAQQCVLDMLLAMLRWENQCVRPLYQLRG